MRASIPLGVLKGFALISSADPTRYILNGVCIQRSGETEGYAVATNGRALVALRIEARQFEGDGQIIVPNEVIRKLQPVSTKLGLTSIEIRDEEGSSGQVHISQRGFGITFKKIEGNFPAWRTVIPTGSAVETKVWPFNAEFMANIQKAAQLSTGCKTGVFISRFGSDGPIVVQNECEEFLGILMPILFVERSLPSWAYPPSQPQATATTNLV